MATPIFADAFRETLLAQPTGREGRDQYTTFIRCMFPSQFAGKKVPKPLRAALANLAQHATPSVIDLALQVAAAAAPTLTAEEITWFIEGLPPVDIGIQLAPLAFTELRADICTVLERFEPGHARASLLVSLVDRECIRVLDALPDGAVPETALAYYASHRDPEARRVVARRANDPVVLRRTLKPATRAVDEALLGNGAAPDDALITVIQRTTPATFQRLDQLTYRELGPDVRTAIIQTLERIHATLTAPNAGTPDATVQRLSLLLSRARTEPVTAPDRPRVAAPPRASTTKSEMDRTIEVARSSLDAVELDALVTTALDRLAHQSGIDFGFSLDARYDRLLGALVQNPCTPTAALLRIAAHPTGVVALTQMPDRPAPDVLRVAFASIPDLSNAKLLVQSHPPEHADAIALSERFADPTLDQTIAGAVTLTSDDIARMLDRALASEFLETNVISTLLGQPAATDAQRMAALTHYDPERHHDLELALGIVRSEHTGAAVLDELLARTPSPGMQHQNGSPTPAILRHEIANHPNARPGHLEELLHDPEPMVAIAAAHALNTPDAALALFDNPNIGRAEVLRMSSPAVLADERVVDRLRMTGEADVRLATALRSPCISTEERQETVRQIVGISGTQILTDDLLVEILAHSDIDQATRSAVFETATVSTIERYIPLAVTDDDWVALIGHADVHVATAAAASPHAPPHIGVTVTVAPTVKEGADALRYGIPAPKARTSLQWHELPTLDDLPLPLAPEVAELDGTTITIDDNPFTVRTIRTGGELAQNADFMGNCTNDHWRRIIQEGNGAVLRVVDPRTGETIYNVGLRIGQTGEWFVAEVNSRFNRGAGPSAKAACEALAPPTATPSAQVLENHTALLARMQASVASDQSRQAAR